MNLNPRFMDDADSDMSEDDLKTYKEMMKRDRRRWTLADRDDDNSLSKGLFNGS